MKKNLNDHINVGPERDVPQKNEKRKNTRIKSSVQSDNSASRKKVSNIHRQ